MTVLCDATTDHAIEYVQDNLKRLGDVVSVEHKRNGENAEYETIIYGTRKDLRIQSGFSSGYQGTGPRALVDLLTQFGFNKSEVEEKVFYNSDDRFEFIFKK